MDEIKRCLDTYALVEIKLGNPNYEFIMKSNFIIADITLAEFYSVLLREENEQTANYWIKKLEYNSRSVSREILIEAVKFRHENKKTNISFYDAVGYIFSLKHNCVFVTGDKEFKNFEKVEFIK